MQTDNVIAFSDWPFRRDAYYGTNFTWYGVDSSDRIASISTGEMPIPRIVFESEREYWQAHFYFNGLKERTDAILLEKFEAKVRNSGGSVYYPFALQEAKNGLYSFSDSEIPTFFGYRCICELFATPVKPLTIVDLPKEISSFVLRLRFKSLDFSETKQLIVTDHFVCET